MRKVHVVVSLDMLRNREDQCMNKQTFDTLTTLKSLT